MWNSFTFTMRTPFTILAMASCSGQLQSLREHFSSDAFIHKRHVHESHAPNLHLPDRSAQTLNALRVFAALLLRFNPTVAFGASGVSPTLCIPRVSSSRMRTCSRWHFLQHRDDRLEIVSMTDQSESSHARKHMNLRRDDNVNASLSVTHPEIEQMIERIRREEMTALARHDTEQQEENLPTIMERVQRRAAEETTKSGYRPGDITDSVINVTRGEIQKQLASDWDGKDVGLLLKVALFLGATAAAPMTGLAAMPIAALLSTYKTALRMQLGGRAFKEIRERIGKRAKPFVSKTVRGYTGKDEYEFGDLTTATVHKITGNKDYKFGDFTKKTVRAYTGKEKYKFGDLTTATVQKVTGNKNYKFGDFTKSAVKSVTGKAKNQFGNFTKILRWKLPGNRDKHVSEKE